MHKKWAFAIVVLLCGVMGCTLDSIPDRGQACPGQSEGGKLSFIQVDSETRCDQESCPEYAESFELNICPKTVRSCHLSSKKEYYCMQCPDDQAVCDGVCIKGESDLLHCGAKGDCNHEDSEDVNYQGIACRTDEKCINRKCVKSDCSGIFCDSRCTYPEEDKTHCGAKGACTDTDENSDNFKGFICGDYGECVSGHCECLEGGVKCNGVCINPSIDNHYCGATGDCSSDLKNDPNYKGEACSEIEICAQGNCILNDCPDPEKLCSSAEGLKCKNITNDPEHCGDCGINCNSSLEKGQISQGCVDGTCISACDSANGFIECDAKCVDKMNDVYNCGECKKQCEVGQVCSDGECKTGGITCNEFQCFDNGACLSDNDEKCGSSCTNCNSVLNVSQGTCNSGVCYAVSCNSGFHLTADGKCDGNNNDACGSPNQYDVKNCNISNGTGSCDISTGQCNVICNTGFHEELGNCVKDDDSHCGVAKTTCSEKEKCIEGSCRLIECEPSDEYKTCYIDEEEGFCKSMGTKKGKEVTCVTQDEADEHCFYFPYKNDTFEYYDCSAIGSHCVKNPQFDSNYNYAYKNQGWTCECSAGYKFCMVDHHYQCASSGCYKYWN